MDAAAQRDKRAGGTAVTRPGRAALGISANTSSPPPSKGKGPTKAAKRAERFEALATARAWLGARARALDPDGYAGDTFRTHDCLWSMVQKSVGLHYSAKFQAAHYGGLVTCGSVWACPCCAPKIQERRRQELQTLVDWAYANNVAPWSKSGAEMGPVQPYQPAMVTLTFPHTRADRLRDLIKRQRAALKRLRSGKRWEKFAQRCRYGGLVRSLELTHGANGWHLHTHELWLIGELDEDAREAFLAELIELWIIACAAAGLLNMDDQDQVEAFRQHSVDVRHAVNSSDYLAKMDQGSAWGVDRELASANAKKGRRGGVHPHEFLIRQGPGDRARYIEYAEAMRDERCRQLYWSPGLHARVGVVEKSDKQVATEEREAADLLGLLSPEQWRMVRARRARAQLLDAVERGGWAAAAELLAALEREAAEALPDDADGAGDLRPAVEPEPVAVPVEHPAPAPHRPPAVTPLHEWLAIQRAANPSHWAAIYDGETIQPRRLRLPAWITAHGVSSRNNGETTQGFGWCDALDSAPGRAHRHSSAA